MSDRERVTIDPAFSFSLPEKWAAEPDDEEGVSVYSPDGSGLLHLVAFPNAAEEEGRDPAEELYAFLEEQGIEIEEDEVEDVDLAEGAELALCEYLSAADEEEEEEETYWLVGVAMSPETLVFVSYSCPSGEEEKEREQIREILGSLQVK
ncbi:MAG: hypothetical protein KY464_03605 [Gemmatimonadetes bacterium]|nr:hypothetical protein [Gemmatimonadota bacterium]